MNDIVFSLCFVHETLKKDVERGPLVDRVCPWSYPRAPECRNNLHRLAIRFDLQEVVYSRDTRHLLRFGFDSRFLLVALDRAS